MQRREEEVSAQLHNTNKQCSEHAAEGKKQRSSATRHGSSSRGEGGGSMTGSSAQRRLDNTQMWISEMCSLATRQRGGDDDPKELDTAGSGAQRQRYALGRRRGRKEDAQFHRREKWRRRRTQVQPRPPAWPIVGGTTSLSASSSSPFSHAAGEEEEKRWKGLLCPEGGEPTSAWPPPQARRSDDRSDATQLGGSLARMQRRKRKTRGRRRSEKIKREMSVLT